MQHAILTEADAKSLLVGLEVNVGGTAGDGIHQDLVDVAHHGRLVNIEFLLGYRALLGGGLFEIDQIRGNDLAHNRMGGLQGTIDGLLDRHRQLILLDQHCLRGQAGVEADFIQGLVVGRVG